jgi:hypothetical protein
VFVVWAYDARTVLAAGRARRRAGPVVNAGKCKAFVAFTRGGYPCEGLRHACSVITAAHSGGTLVARDAREPLFTRANPGRLTCAVLAPGRTVWNTVGDGIAVLPRVVTWETLAAEIPRANRIECWQVTRGIGATDASHLGRTVLAGGSVPAMVALAGLWPGAASRIAALGADRRADPAVTTETWQAPAFGTVHSSIKLGVHAVIKNRAERCRHADISRSGGVCVVYGPGAIERVSAALAALGAQQSESARCAAG